MGAYTEIVDFTFTANETSRTFTNFGTITKDDFYKVVFTHVNGSASNCTVRLLANSSVDANYHTQFLFAEASTVGAARINKNRFTRTTGSQTGTTIGYLKLSENDRFNILINNTFRNDSSTFLNFYYQTSSGATFTSGITSLTLTAAVTNALGTGSRIQIYKLDAEKVADITVASNTTQVDISNLSIDKDSEYLLVSHLINAGTAGDFSMMVNDNTTASNYFHQYIGAVDSSAIVERVNTAGFNSVGTTTFPSLVYSHIKLSNIGAYTSQNYGLTNMGRTNPIIFNYFVSSTAENITSITKLNIVANSTNGIAAGTRFHLYKLYE